MERVFVKMNDITSIFSSVGGRWTFICIAVFIVCEVFLVDLLLLKQAQIAMVRQPHGDAEVEDVMKQMK
jgi:hypothetical protein